MSLPVVRLSGSPYEQGLRHGRELKDRIAHNLRVYFDRFEQEAKLPRGEVRQRAARFGPAIEAESPAYFAGLRGIAEGSGFDPNDLTALNVRYELLYYETGRIALAAGCTAFAVLPPATANRHLLIGQNWDWIPDVQGAVLHTVEGDGSETISFTEAGIFGGKIGFNSAGLGLAVNGLQTTDDDWSRPGKPFHVRCYEILGSRGIETAARAAADPIRSCSANYLIAQVPDRVVDIEAASARVRFLDCENNRIVHTNHFVDPAALGIVEPPSERRPHSLHRRTRMQTLLASRPALAVSELGELLRDHDGYPYSICRHPDPSLPAGERYSTVTSVIIDLNAREMEITDGPPCTAAYQHIAGLTPNA
jgi:isopenicillin-N N-acyltransferase-like protein